MKKFLLRFADKEEQVLKTIKELAESNRRSANGEIIRAISFYLQNSDDAKAVRKEESKKKLKSP